MHAYPPPTNPFAIGYSTLEYVQEALGEVQDDFDLEIADLTAGQMIDYANAFRKIAAFASDFERELRSTAKTSFY